LPLAVYADGPDAPVVPPETVAAHAGEEAGVALGWTITAPPWLDRLRRPPICFMAGYGLSPAIAAGRARPFPVRISAVAPLLAGRLRPSVAVVAGRPDGRGFRFVSGVGWAAAACRAAGAVVVEVWPDAPALDSPAIPGDVVATAERGAAPPDPPPAPKVGGAERRIGELVAAMVPDGATVQWGPGTIGAAAVRALDRPVRVLSGLVTDELVGLSARGLLQGVAEATYMWGGGELKALAGAGAVRLRPVEETHDPHRLAATPRFVAINTAVEVGLDGATNVERVGGRLVAGPGGHADYCEAASRSVGGLSIVALRATRGERSSIVVRPEVVTTARTDVDVVVTEYGVADLREADDATRAQRLISVAAPDHRDRLAAAAAGR
jgi:acyl-CoA hydrolase